MKNELLKNPFFRFDLFSKHSGIIHFVSTRNLGDMSLSGQKNSGKIIENRKKLTRLLGISADAFVFQQQVHGNRCSVVLEKDKASGLLSYKSALQDNDAMISNEKGVCLMLMAGDCVPLLFYDPVQKVIGAAHAGWRGTFKKIAQSTIEKMVKTFRCEPENIIAGIGPSIGKNSYEIDTPVYKEFKKHIANFQNFFSEGKEKGKYYLDLWAANKQQLTDAGILENHIEIPGLCTYKNKDLFFSARRGDKERFVAGIMLL